MVGLGPTACCAFAKFEKLQNTRLDRCESVAAGRVFLDQRLARSYVANPQNKGVVGMASFLAVWMSVVLIDYLFNVMEHVAGCRSRHGCTLTIEGLLSTIAGANQGELCIQLVLRRPGALVLGRFYLYFFIFSSFPFVAETLL